MKYSSGNPDALKQQFWSTLAESPFLFLERDGNPSSSVPMTAQLDKNADSAIWFFTSKNSDFAKLGPVTASFTGKDHDIFARIQGRLSIETDQDRFDQFWNNFVAAWYEDGKDDSDILFLRMDLDDAEIWSGELGLLNTAKMVLGMNVKEDAEQRHAENVAL